MPWHLLALVLAHGPLYTNADLGVRQRRVVPVTAEVMAGFRDRQYVYLPPEWEMNRVLQMSEPLPPSIQLPPLDFHTPPPDPPLIMWLPRGRTHRR